MVALITSLILFAAVWLPIAAIAERFALDRIWFLPLAIMTAYILPITWMAFERSMIKNGLMNESILKDNNQKLYVNKLI